MKFELVGGSHDGEVIDFTEDRFGHTLQELRLPKKQTTGDVEPCESNAEIELYVKTPVGLMPDGSTKFIFAIK